MLSFAYPWVAVLLPLPLLIWWLIPPYKVQVRALRLPFFNAVVTAAGAEASSGSIVLGRSFWQMCTLITVWCLLVLALGKPEFLGEPVVRTEAARDLMLAIDLSGSMDYVDFENDEGRALRRLDAVKLVVDDFVAARENDRVGMIVFGNKAFLQLPFTRDLATARDLLALTDVGIAGPKTAVGDAIGLAIKSFESSDAQQRMLILLTDGNDTASKMTPLSAADIAASHHVEVFTIGVGDPAASGEDRVDFATLEAIADRTGGKFFRAENVNALTEVYRRIDQLVPVEVKTETWRPRHSMVHWPLGMALAITLLACLVLLFTSHRGLQASRRLSNHSSRRRSNHSSRRRSNHSSLGDGR